MKMMKLKRLLTLVGSICLTLMLAALLLPACAPAEAPGEEADCSDAEADLAASEKKVGDLEDEVGDLEDEVADMEKEITDLKKPVEAREWRLQLLCTAETNDYQICGIEFSDFM